jgi:hypothetical protein
METLDNHTIYVRARGYTHEEVRAQVAAWTDALQDVLGGGAKAYVLTLATDREGMFLDFGYLYCVEGALYHVLLGRQPSGLDGVLVDVPGEPEALEAPRWDVPQPPMDWVETSERAHPSRRLVPAPPLLDMTGTQIRLDPAYVRVADVTRYLRVWNLPEGVTPRDLWYLGAPYTSELEVVFYRDRKEAVLVFPADTPDANFAAYFLRKVELPTGDVLVFKVSHERPHKGGERYP